MSYRPWWRRFACLAVAFLCVGSSGCNPLAAIYFLFLLPPPKIPAASTDLDEQTVVVLAYASHAAQFEHPGIGDDLVKGVVLHLRDNVPGIKLADPRDVRRWCDEHPAYELVDVGREFEATRVLYLEIESFSLYERQSAQLYRGRAKIRVQVADVEQDGDIIWDDIIETEYPGGRPVPAGEVSPELFRLKCMRYLSKRIAMRFFSYRPDEDFTIN